MRSMIAPINSGSPTRELSANGQSNTTRTSGSFLELREATCRMWQRLRGGIPEDIQNIVFDFTRSEPRNKKGHLLGSWPRVSESLAKAGAPLSDLMAPVREHALNLKRDIYHTNLPPLEMVEQQEAEIALAIQKAEITHDLRSLKSAAREEIIVAELLEEVADRACHVTTRGALIGGTK